MLKFNFKFSVGTKVKVEGIDGWQTLNSFENRRQLITLVGVEGMFQRAHVITFTNKAK